MKVVILQPSYIPWRGYFDQICRAVDKAASYFGRLDILVNNAGVAPENLAENYREEDFDLTLAVNLKGTFFASQAAGRVMIRQRNGRIINLSSQAGFVALPGESVYCMTKAAISHLTKCLAILQRQSLSPTRYSFFQLHRDLNPAAGLVPG